MAPGGVVAGRRPLDEPLLPPPPGPAGGPGGFEGAAERVRESVRSATRDHREPVSEDRAFELEGVWLGERQRFLAEEHGLQDRPRLAVALSGGGQRAAAFACGVFWTLAERALLPHVSHLSAVSGGGYAASALLSHLLAAGAPDPGEGLHDWYRRIVADCMLRFQDNISHLVRPAGRRRWGSSALDLSLFVLCGLGSVALNMLMVAVYVALPLAAFLEQDLGPWLRKLACYPPQVHPESTSAGTAATWLLGFPLEMLQPLAARAVLLVAILAAAMVFGVARRMVSCCRAPAKAPGEVSWKTSLGYLLGRSARVMALRSVVIGTFYLVVVVVVFASQCYHSGLASRHPLGGSRPLRLCYEYIREAVDSGRYRCSDIDTWNGDLPWYQAADDGHGDGGAFARTYLNETWAGAAGLLGHTELPNASAPARRVGLFLWFNLLLLFCALASAVFRSRLLNEVACAVGPLWAAWLVAGIAEWSAYGPLTGQPLLGGFLPYSRENCSWFFAVSFALVMASVPFYGQLQQGIHNFNVMKLRKAFYEPKNKHWLLEQVAANPYCPNLVLGACLQDYSRPTDREPYADFALAPLFLGGRRTGFLPTAGTRCRLAMAMGVSGGAVDMAMAVLSHKVRWWIGLLGLQMGAWVRVRRWRAGVCPCLERWRASLLRLAIWSRCVREDDPRAQELLEELLVRSPGILCHWLWYVAFLAVVLLDGEQHADVQRCLPTGLYATFLGSFLLLVLAVHLSFLPCLAAVLRSPFLRHILMIFNYNHRSWDPPEQLYLLDGGLADSLGVLALLRRRERWMIATDAASPPNDHCRFVRECIEGARQERLCSFAGPEQPGRAVEFLLEDFERDRSRPYLHLKVLYEPWLPGSEPADLFFVSMRIPPGDETPLRGTLRREEIYEQFSFAQSSQSSFGSRRELAGVCCCDGCHEGMPKVCQRCCGSFPQVSMANQFLTPRLFSELCRLGHELSSQALDRMQEEWRRPARAEAAAGSGG